MWNGPHWFLLLQQKMEEAADIPPRVGVHRSVHHLEVRLLRLHCWPATHRAGSLPTVLREQQVSSDFQPRFRRKIIWLTDSFSCCLTLEFLCRKPYSHYNNFLDEVYNYETDLEENRISLAHQIFSKYLTKPQGESSNTKVKIQKKIPFPPSPGSAGP